MIGSLIQDLGQPEYVHVLINPLPVYGLALAAIGLSIGLLQRSRQTQIATLALILLCSAIAWPVAHYGSAGYDRVLSLSDAQGEAWLKAHAQRADQFLFYFYALAAVAAVAILLPLRWPKSAGILALVTLLFSLGVLAAGGYIAYAGGRIRHREFRNAPAPTLPVQEDEH
jgi:hypothetical protein